MLKFSTTQTPVNGIPNVYETNVPGIGIIVWDDYQLSMYVGNTLTPWWRIRAGGNSGVFLTNVKMHFYVTGTVSTGTVSFSGPFVESWGNSPLAIVAGALKYAEMKLNGSVSIQSTTCETPNISVNLDKHLSSEFSGINSKSAAKAFNFEIKKCDPGMNSVNYTFKPAAGVTLKQAGTSNQYITLDGSSTATGVGIQVLYENDTLVPFNSKIKYTGYNKTTGGSYTIPMKARYIQTASTITGGTANSAVEFTMSYE
jgi:major type 1 subunit fimbrin (pilin)